jgi:WD40 repeat protein/serine/threonine protein kinase
VTECRRDELAASRVESCDGPADLADVDDSHVEAELRGLVSVIEMLDRAGARMGTTIARNDAPAPALEPGIPGILGDFTIVRAIGRGGMGVVYEAMQESLNRRVALKILPASSADDPRKVKRFLVEAQAAACLHHPHIVPVYLVGSENGLHYYAMQYVDGRTLAEVIAASSVYERLPDAPANCRRELRLPTPLANDRLADNRRSEPALGGDRLANDRRTEPPPTVPQSGSAAPCPERAGRGFSSPRAAADLGRQAALALQFAHEQGIIHRDIKPSNLLVDESGWLWVSDFGLARVAGQADMTLSGTLLGTLRYMSPEQAFGARVVVDHRADVYSLGATLYELLTLRPVFECDDRLELLRRIAEEEPPALRLLDPAIPRDLETIVRKAMAKDPGERYVTALELADDLGRFLQNRPILARPPGAIDRASKWVRRHRPAAAGAAIILILVVIGLAAGAFWRNRTLRQHNSALSSALKRAEENESATRRLLYDSQMILAHQSLASGHVEFAQEILEGLGPSPGGLDPRGFEWHYLRRLCHREFSLLSRQETLTTAIALAPDGRTLVTGHADGVVVFWDLAEGRERARVQAHAGLVGKVSFSPEGRFQATSSHRGVGPNQVRLWDARKASLVASLPQVDGGIPYLTFAAAGKALWFMEHGLTGDESKNKLIFWDLTRGPENPLSGGAPIACSKMAYAPQGEWLATNATASNVTLRDATTGKVRETLPKSFPWIGELAISPDGRTLAVATRKEIVLWDILSKRELGSVAVAAEGPFTFSPDGNRLACRAGDARSIALIAEIRTNPRRLWPERASGNMMPIAFSPDGRTLAGEKLGRVVTLWDTTSGQTLAEFTRETRNLGRLIFTPDGESLIVTTEDGPIRSWHFVKESQSIAQIVAHQAEVWGLAYTPDGRELITSADDHDIKIWNARDGGLRSTLKGHTAMVPSVAVSPDPGAPGLLASAGFENTVRLWDLPGGTPRSVLHGHTDQVRAVAFSPDGRLIASAGLDKTVRIWDAQSGKPIMIFAGHTDVVRALAFEPHGTLLFSASNDRTIRGIDVNRCQEAFSLRCPEQNSALAFSRDGSLLASGDDKGTLTIWDARAWSMRRSVKGSDAGILGAAFSPDGRTLAAACDDAKVRLWDPLTGQVTLVLEGHSQRVNAVVFAPDGMTLASASHDGTVRLWNAR